MPSRPLCRSKDAGGMNLEMADSELVAAYRLNAADGKGFADLDDRIALLERPPCSEEKSNYLAARPK
jgi:hypothetical protein